jgi:WXG100 family type VII secretion target
MGNSQIKYSGAAMTEAAEAIRACHSMLLQEKEGLEQHLKSLNAAWYSSNAADNYQAKQIAYNAAFDDVQQMLMNICNALEEAKGNAAEIERSLGRMWS